MLRNHQLSRDPLLEIFDRKRTITLRLFVFIIIVLVFWAKHAARGDTNAGDMRRARFVANLQHHVYSYLDLLAGQGVEPAMIPTVSARDVI